MSETKGLLGELDGKVSKLLSNLKELNDVSNKKSQEIVDLKNELKKKSDSFDLLEKENEALKKEVPNENQEELKVKIGEMVKEIDRCISLLKV